MKLLLSYTLPSTQASLPAIEKQVMCVTCKIPLQEANSPQATSERTLIKQLIGRGRSEGQIKHTLVAEYGPAVLAMPQASGFNLAVYVVPPAVVLAAALTIAAALPRWRRRALNQAPWSTAARTLSPAEEARLQGDMALFED